MHEAQCAIEYATRRWKESELSAMRMRTILLGAWTLWCAVCATPACAAAPSGDSEAGGSRRTPSAIERPLTRADVDLMLRDARSAIQQGRLEEADKILVRAENAHVHYSLLHFGPTPSTVRRELNRARRLPGAAAQAPSNAPVTDVAAAFAAEGKQAVAAEVQGAPPSAANLQKGDLGSALIVASQQPQQHASSAEPVENPFGREPQANPFAMAGERTVAPARYAATDVGGGVERAAWEQTPAAAPSHPGATPAVENQPGSNTAWALPNAPLPPTGVADRYAGGSLGFSPPERLATAGTTANADPSGPSTKQRTLALLTEARQALDAGNLRLAEQLSQEAAALGVPESQFLPDEDRPSLLAWDIERAKQGRNDGQNSATRLPSANPPATAPLADTATRLAGFDAEELPLPNASSDAEAVDSPFRDDAYDAVSDANAAAPPDAEAPRSSRDAHESGSPVGDSVPPPSMLDVADQSQHVLARQLSAEVGKRQSEAQRLRSEDPERALAILREAQQMVNDSQLPESSQRELLGRIEITLQKTQKYIKDNAAEIELDQRNTAVVEGRDRDREMKLKLQQKIADLVEEFNRLRDEHRYAEAEIVARRLYELAPDDPVAQQVLQTAKFIRREMLNRGLVQSREDGIWESLNDVEKSSVSNVGDGRELVFDQKHWGDFVKNRKGTKDRIERRTERELEIERRLKTPVMLRYEETPLAEVIDGLSQLAGINIHLDPRGLNQEGVGSDTAVTLNLNKEISLESALNLILEPLHLSYVIKDDVLKITSEQLRDGEIYAVTYNVSDLVIPIPNFVPSSGIGLQGLIHDAHAAAGYGQNGIAGAGPSVLVGGRDGQPQGNANDQILAQQLGGSSSPTGMSPSTVPIGAGPGGMGGGANADFDSLIDLIVSTVETQTWAENGGGEAEIRPFPTNLSLVISQTQAVHEQIADLLEQLRRLQDLQVTIEVRFIRLNDSFFERIGIDFDMNVADRTGLPIGALPPGTAFEPDGRTSQTVGIGPSGTFPNFTADLDVPFRQGSFGLAVPPFVAFDPSSAATFGFAILSDIEAYFVIEAAQGDRRTNVLQAPKVTLFNGQQAFVADALQRPFVVGVIPVVGEFAAAQQPVIVVLNEGTMMTIQAVVSDDRRYVRMTIVPFFTQIGNVDEFTFEGSSSSTSSSSSKDSDEDGKKEEDSKDDETVRSGVTVQLPSFQFISVVTTVSVPDGGTVLLGGIKRLSEGRNEFGVPLLSKVPYINRLFRNVAIGRTTDSLMMMVTPRIIIQEEEEERLGIAVP
jgi:general secretion pathway protein D